VNTHPFILEDQIPNPDYHRFSLRHHHKTSLKGPFP
jgi:hypothetical protein